MRVPELSHNSAPLFLRSRGARNKCGISGTAYTSAHIRTRIYILSACTHVSIGGPFLSSHSLLVTRASDRSCNGDTDAITTTIATTPPPPLLLHRPSLPHFYYHPHFFAPTLELTTTTSPLYHYLHRRRFLHNHYHNLTTRDWLGALIWLRGYQRTRFRFLPCRIVERIFK